jgi:hypothetical protein
VILPSAFTRNLPAPVEPTEELEVATDELDLMLEELVPTLETLDLLLEVLTTLDLLLEDVVATELDDVGQPFTTPKGAGWVAQVDGAIQLLPFS